MPGSNALSPRIKIKVKDFILKSLFFASKDWGSWCTCLSSTRELSVPAGGFRGSLKEPRLQSVWDPGSPLPVLTPTCKTHIISGIARPFWQTEQQYPHIICPTASFQDQRGMGQGRGVPSLDWSPFSSDSFPNSLLYRYNTGKGRKRPGERIDMKQIHKAATDSLLASTGYEFIIYAIGFRTGIASAIKVAWSDISTVIKTNLNTGNQIFWLLDVIQ